MDELVGRENRETLKRLYKLAETDPIETLAELAKALDRHGYCPLWRDTFERAIAAMRARVNS